ncbi:unnamed protein product [Meloidogyne enterolobii]|uniref:Uncharacterized protein n=1 Tax=Meloidogyne enterolobii TaxID=390850 RepID=A0ACB0ZEH4_MELEN
MLLILSFKNISNLFYPLSSLKISLLFIIIENCVTSKFTRYSSFTIPQVIQVSFIFFFPPLLNFPPKNVHGPRPSLYFFNSCLSSRM